MEFTSNSYDKVIINNILTYIKRKLGIKLKIYHESNEGYPNFYLLTLLIDGKIDIQILDMIVKAYPQYVSNIKIIFGEHEFIEDKSYTSLLKIIITITSSNSEALNISEYKFNQYIKIDKYEKTDIPKEKLEIINNIANFIWNKNKFIPKMKIDVRYDIYESVYHINFSDIDELDYSFIEFLYKSVPKRIANIIFHSHTQTLEFVILKDFDNQVNTQISQRIKKPELSEIEIHAILNQTKINHKKLLNPFNTNIQKTNHRKRKRTIYERGSNYYSNITPNNIYKGESNLQKKNNIVQYPKNFDFRRFFIPNKKRKLE